MMQDVKQELADLRKGLSVFSELRPNPISRYKNGWFPKHDYLTTQFSFDQEAWENAVDELYDINGAEVYLANFSAENFLYYLPIYAASIIDLIADDEAPYLLDYLLDALLNRVNDSTDFIAIASPAQTLWLKRFLEVISSQYQAEDDEEDNNAIRTKANQTVRLLTS